MKKTLHEKIEEMLQKANERKLFLQSSLKDYAKHGNYQEAMKIDIKIDQFTLFIQQLEEALK